VTHLRHKVVRPRTVDLPHTGGKNRSSETISLRKREFLVRILQQASDVRRTLHIKFVTHLRHKVVRRRTVQKIFVGFDPNLAILGVRTSRLVFE
jgi:hypothetical protein